MEGRCFRKGMLATSTLKRQKQSFEPFRLLCVEVSNNAVDMESYDCTAAGIGEKEGAVFAIVHKQVFGQNGRRERVLQDVERGLDVGIAVGEIHPELVAGKVLLCRLVEIAGDVIGFGVSRVGEGAPAASVHPLVAHSCGIDVDGDQHDGRDARSSRA